MDSEIGTNTSRGEIFRIFSGCEVVIAQKESTANEDMKWVINNLKDKHCPCDKPDAYIKQGDKVYALEHFQISQYRHSKKGDFAKQAEAVKRRRDKLTEDAHYDLDPSIEGFLDSLRTALDKHMEKADTYKDNVIKICQGNGVGKFDYRLIVVLEDVSDHAAYINKDGNAPRNPILFDKVVDIMLTYKGKLWGVIYFGGDTKKKEISGFTVAELEEKGNRGELLDIQLYRTQHSADTRIVSSNGEAFDEHIVRIRLNDRV